VYENHPAPPQHKFKLKDLKKRIAENVNGKKNPKY
jgi:hypothetical protein